MDLNKSLIKQEINMTKKYLKVLKILSNQGSTN